MKSDDRRLAESGIREVEPRHTSVKEVVFPFMKFEAGRYAAGPRIRSTGEVMGIDTDFARAFAKSQLAAGMKLPVGGTAFLSVREERRATHRRHRSALTFPVPIW